MIGSSLYRARFFLPANFQGVKYARRKSQRLAPQDEEGSCRAFGGILPTQHGTEECQWRPFDVVAPLKESDLLIDRGIFAYTSEWSQEVPQPRPQPLQRVVMHFADAVPVVIPRPLPRVVAHRRVDPAHRRESVVASPLVGVHPRPRPCRLADHLPERLPVGVPDDGQSDLRALAPGHATDRRPVIIPGAVAQAFVRPATRRVGGIVVWNSFFLGWQRALD